MGILLAFAVGYIVGGRGGARDFDDVMRAVKELRDSEEFHGLLGALRSHGAQVLRSAADMLEEASMPGPENVTDLAERVRLLMKKA